jgi:hypothetical protein
MWTPEEEADFQGHVRAVRKELGFAPCLRHYALDTPPKFCERCGKPWKAVMDGREGRKRRRERRA